MGFERARNEEQKNIRIKQITDVARMQFKESKYEDITLASIAKELSFTRANLYKYVSTKEEIFLYIISEDLTKWVDSLEAVFGAAINPDIEDFSKAWSESMFDQMEMIKVLSLLFSVIEKNVTVEKLVPYKIKFYAEMERILNLLGRIFPDLTSEQLRKILGMQMYFFMGLYPATTENEVQRQAYEKMGMPYDPPDFKEIYAEFTAILLNSFC